MRRQAVQTVQPSNSTDARLVSITSRALVLVVLLGRDVERHFAPPHPAVAIALEALLADVQVERDVELAAPRQVLLDVLARIHAIHGRAEARTEERVVEVLADNGVV